MDEGAFETKEEKALWCTFTSLKAKIRPGITLSPVFNFLFCNDEVTYLHSTADQFLPFLNLLRDSSVLCTDMEVDDFVEASSDLLQPLEDFFNNVFVMVVCFYYTIN